MDSVCFLEDDEVEDEEDESMVAADRSLIEDMVTVDEADGTEETEDILLVFGLGGSVRRRERRVPMVQTAGLKWGLQVRRLCKGRANVCSIRLANEK